MSIEPDALTCLGTEQLDGMMGAKRSQPLEVSIVMPCLNESETLATCIPEGETRAE